MLAVRTHGSGPPITALHGFTATGDQFAPMAVTLGRTVIAIDLPGHGNSDREDTTFPTVVTQVASTISDAPLLGYSQGARLALAVAIDHPQDIPALVLISGTAGIADDERAARAEADLMLADRITQIGIERFIDEWTSAGITSTAHLPAEQRSADRTMRTANTAEGLANALRGFGQGAQPSLWQRLGGLSIPTLLIAGEHDRRYTDIAERMHERIPDSRIEIVQNAGHNPLLDHTEATCRTISSFLEDVL